MFHNNTFANVTAEVSVTFIYSDFVGQRMGIRSGAIHYPAYEPSKPSRCLWGVTFWPRTAPHTAVACLFLRLSFWANVFATASAGLLRSHRTNPRGLFTRERSTRLWECPLCQRLGRKHCRIRLNPKLFNVRWYIHCDTYYLYSRCYGSSVENLTERFAVCVCVSLHNVHLFFFHCKWMCTMAV